MGGLAAYVVSTEAEMAEALGIRRKVFIEEQAVPVEIEIDEHDRPEAQGKTAVHVLVRLDGRAVGTGRLLLEGEHDNAHIGRVAVLAEHRGKGVGRAVMLALHDQARSRGYRSITLAAQTHAVGFYERLGYKTRGGVFLDAGIEHRWMDLNLEP